MKISYDWLKDYIEIDKSPEQLGEDLSLFGHESESIEKVNGDMVLDLEITPNRGDCLSILGIARELAALYNLKLKAPTFAKASVGKQKIDKNVEIQVQDPKICPRYTARIIDDVKIGESPKWIQKRLASYGFRPVNNIVDITNYVMVATGQPLHAFNYDKLANSISHIANRKLMNIRQAKKGEKVMTLDGKNRILNEGAIIIEDNDKIYDLAGIMGGLKSEVDENTKTIILQGSIFDPVLIRRASKYLNHTTDASYRYERGVDFEGTVYGVDMATQMILDVCKNAKSGELIDKIYRKQTPVKIQLDPAKINHLLGTNIDKNQMIEYLKRLNFRVDGLNVTPPSYRNYDIHIWQDLAEEIARLYGYNNLNKNSISKTQQPTSNLEWQKKETIKDKLVEIGFIEIYSYSFADKDKIELLGFKISDSIEIANPLSPETQYLRPSILPSLLSAIAKNPWAPEVNIFEIENVFSKSGEWTQLGIATTGKYDEMLNKAIKELKLNLPQGGPVGVDQKILDAYKIRRQVKYVLIDIDDIKFTNRQIINNKISNNKYKPISQYPPTVRDLAFILDTRVDGQTVASEIQSLDKSILLTELFDEFESPKFGKNKKNLAFHIWLQNMKGPVSENDSEKIIQNIIKIISQKYQAKLRSKEEK